jgi:hypothetical protein
MTFFADSEGFSSIQLFRLIAMDFQSEADIRRQLVEQTQFLGVEKIALARTEIENSDDFVANLEGESRDGAVTAPECPVHPSRGARGALQIVTHLTLAIAQRARHRRGIVPAIVRQSRELLEITGAKAALGDDFNPIAGLIQTTDPGALELALLDGDAAGLRKQCLRIAQAHNRLIDIAQYSINAIEISDTRFVFLALASGGCHGLRYAINFQDRRTCRIRDFASA